MTRILPRTRGKKDVINDAVRSGGKIPPDHPSSFLTFEQESVLVRRVDHGEQFNDTNHTQKPRGFQKPEKAGETMPARVQYLKKNKPKLGSFSRSVL